MDEYDILKVVQRMYLPMKYFPLYCWTLRDCCVGSKGTLEPDQTSNRRYSTRCETQAYTGDMQTFISICSMFVSHEFSLPRLSNPLLYVLTPHTEQVKPGISPNASTSPAFVWTNDSGRCAGETGGNGEDHD